MSSLLPERRHVNGHASGIPEVSPLKKGDCLATEPQSVRRQWREYQVQNCATGTRKVCGQGEPTAALPRLTVFAAVRERRGGFSGR